MKGVNMLVSTYIKRLIEQDLIEKNKKRERERSGKLSASKLFYPTRWQLLYTLGIPTVEKDAYTLGVFDKGDEVEAKFIEYLKKFDLLADVNLPKVHNQYKVTYRGAIGLVDSIINTDKFDDVKIGIIPNEIKSVTSYKLKRIKQNAEIDWHYKLQAGFYALALGTPYYGLTIISKEHDFPRMHILETKRIRKDIETIIDKYQQAKQDWEQYRKLPPLEADKRVEWILNPKYRPFEERWDDDKEVIKFISKN